MFLAYYWHDFDITSTRFKAYGGSFPFNPTCSVVVVEYSKLIISAVLFAVHVRELRARGDAVELPAWKDVAWLAVPAAIYDRPASLILQKGSPALALTPCRCVEHAPL